MKLSACLLALVILTALSCSGGSNNEGVLGEQVADTVSDTRLLKEVQAAANQIVRNQADCETVKSNIDEVNRTFDEAEGRVQTATGRTTLAALKKQVKNIADTCGVM